MKILLIDNSHNQTGASKALLQTIERIPPGEFEFIFLFPTNSKCIDFTISKGYPAYGMNFREISRRIYDIITYIPTLILNIFRIRRLVKKENIQVVHVNDIYNIVGIATKFFCKIKVVTHIRRMPESFPAGIYKFWSRLHVKYANTIVAVSKANASMLPQNTKTTVIYDPLPEMEKMEKYVIKGKLNKVASILCLANYTDGKGHLYVLKLAQRFHQEYPDWQLTFNFYGGVFGLQSNVDYKNSLIQAAEDMRINHFVFFHGQVDNIEGIMKTHDISLNLSDSESFSRVTLESLFFGVPTIATNVGGTNEMLLDKQTGIIVNRADIDNMYEGFKTLILNDDLRQKVSQNSYSFVRESFGDRQTVDKLINVYRSLQ